MRAAPHCALPAALVLLLAGEARAHRLEIDQRPVEGGKIRLEVFYSDGKPAGGAQVVVRGPGGAELARGLADPDGAFEFPAPAGTPLEVEARHGGAHRAAISFAAGSFGRGAAGIRGAPPRGGVAWGRLAAGVAAIAVLSLIARRVLMRRRGASRD